MQFKYYREQDIYPIKINNLIPYYVSDLEDSLKFRVMELFTDKEIKDFDIVEREEDIDLKNLLKKKFMSNLNKGQFIYAMNVVSLINILI